MRRRRTPQPCNRNDGWYRANGESFFCLWRGFLPSVAGLIDNATLYVYIALASCHFEGYATFPGSRHLATLTGKDERAVREAVEDLEILGLIVREPHGRGYRVLFCRPDRARVRNGAEIVRTKKDARLHRRREAAERRTALGSTPPVATAPGALEQDYGEAVTPRVDEFDAYRGDAWDDDADWNDVS